MSAPTLRPIYEGDIPRSRYVLLTRAQASSFAAVTRILSNIKTSGGGSVVVSDGGMAIAFPELQESGGGGSKTRTAPPEPMPVPFSEKFVNASPGSAPINALEAIVSTYPSFEDEGGPYPPMPAVMMFMRVIVENCPGGMLVTVGAGNRIYFQEAVSGITGRAFELPELGPFGPLAHAPAVSGGVVPAALAETPYRAENLLYWHLGMPGGGDFPERARATLQIVFQPVRRFIA
jgi:hypothetical protein